MGAKETSLAEEVVPIVMGKSMVTVEEPVVMIEMIEITMVMMVMKEVIVVIEHEYTGEREEIETDKESRRPPPPPGRGLDPARAPIVIVIGVVGRCHAVVIAKGSDLVSLRLRFRRILLALLRILGGSGLRRLLGAGLRLVGLFGLVIGGAVRNLLPQQAANLL